jgi:hypothetical protein
MHFHWVSAIKKRWFQPRGDLSIKKGGSIIKRASNSDCLTDKNWGVTIKNRGPFVHNDKEF